MVGFDMVTLSIMDTDTTLTDGIIQIIGSDITKDMHTISLQTIETSHIT